MIFVASKTIVFLSLSLFSLYAIVQILFFLFENAIGTQPCQIQNLLSRGYFITSYRASIFKLSNDEVSNKKKRKRKKKEGANDSSHLDVRNDVI